MGSVFTCKLNPCCGDRYNCEPPRQYSDPEPALASVPAPSGAREALKEANAFILAPAEDLKEGVLSRIRAALAGPPQFCQGLEAAMEAVDRIRKWIDAQQYENDVLSVGQLRELLTGQPWPESVSAHAEMNTFGYFKRHQAAIDAFAEQPAIVSPYAQVATTPTPRAVTMADLAEEGMRHGRAISASPRVWEYEGADGVWHQCRDADDACMWAEDGRRIREKFPAANVTAAPQAVPAEDVAGLVSAVLSRLIYPVSPEINPRGWEFREAPMLGEAVRFIKTELAATLTSLSAERDEARSIVRDIHWMAVRYADNRKSYAVGMCNDALRKAYDAGWLKYTGGNDKLDPQYARDGMFDREWVSALDAANARATASEAEASDLRRKLEEARNANGKMHRRAQLAEAINQSVEGILSMWVSVLFGPDGKKTPRYYDYHLFGFALGDIMAQRKKLTARLAASPSAQTDGGGDGS